MFVHTISTLQDGVLKEVNNTKLSLIADNGRHVESVFTKSDNIIVGDEIESDGHLILIDVSILNYSLHLSVTCLINKISKCLIFIFYIMQMGTKIPVRNSSVLS